MTQDAFLYDALRTPRGAGKPSGSLHEVKPIDLVVGLLHELRATARPPNATRMDLIPAAGLDRKAAMT